MCVCGELAGHDGNVGDRGNQSVFPWRPTHFRPSVINFPSCATVCVCNEYSHKIVLLHTCYKVSAEFQGVSM